MEKAKKTKLNKDSSKADSKGEKETPHQELFPVAGIGASAGGLEALELFLANVPEKSGMAYVVIQHLDPTQKGMLPELLQRVTKLKVFQVKENMLVKPNCVYVIPPNKSMSILEGKLHLDKPVETRGLRLPIDFFLRSLSIDRKELGVGVILSGMGSDGSSGLRDIKENNGIVLVQEPDTAKYDSMPNNAIDSVMVDIVASPQELPVKLIEFLKHSHLVKSDPGVKKNSQNALEEIITLLQDFTGNDFSLYKKNTVYRRIERRMGVHKIAKIEAYVKLLKENPKEGDILFKELMIGVTSFFRDNQIWEKLVTSILPDILTHLPSNTILRAWVPGCSTGEEAYSLAIVFKEALEKINGKKNISLQIFATDLDHDAIETARKGIFPVNISNDVSPERLARFFTKSDKGYSLNSDIREMIVFAQHNLIMHPPFINIDIISCRNLLIYLDAELQKKILELFYFSLNREGVMILGNSETLGLRNNLYEPIDGNLKIYKRKKDVEAPNLLNFPSAYKHPKTTSAKKPSTNEPLPNIQSLAENLILQQFSPPGALVNENGDLLFISGRTGKYLEPAVGKANLNIFAMLREGLRNEFHIGFHQALIKKDLVVLHNLKTDVNGSNEPVNISIQFIDKPGPLRGNAMIIFSDAPNTVDAKPPSKTRRKSTGTSTREKELEDELQNTREELQSTIEEIQTSQEELKTTNEELQSANEELQSANEELTSSKEEMQSLNEELQTLNAELMAKIEDFAQVDNDMKNLLNSTDIATLFLDKKLRIRRYTNQATRIFKLIKSDIGRPFTDLVSEIIYPTMAEDALEVLRTLTLIEKQIPGKNGSWFLIRIMPYRTFDDRIDGLVITFINITELKQVEEKWKETEQIQRLLLNTSSDIYIKLSLQWNVTEFNTAAEIFFGVKREEAVEQNYFQMFIAEPMQKKTEQVLEKLLNNKQDGRFKTDVIAAKGNIQNVAWSAKTLFNSSGRASGMILRGESDSKPES